MRGLRHNARVAAILAFLGLQMLRPQSSVAAAPQDAVILPGSGLKAGNLILESDAIVVAKFIKLGAKTTSGSELQMHENQAEIVQFLRCFTQSPLEIDIPVDLGKGEQTPAAGTPYIFFLKKNHTRPAAWAMDPYDAVKLLKATDANIAEVKRLIKLPENYHQLSGSQVTVDEAVKKSNCVFEGAVTKTGFADLGPEGSERYFGVPVRISRLFCGPSINPIKIDISVTFDPHEDPPKVGQSYIFFVDRGPVYLSTGKILPVTDETIAQVNQLLPHPAAQKSESAICDDLSTHDALVTADVVFEGSIENPGALDRGDQYSFVFATPHFCGVKIKTAHIFRGQVAAETGATVFVADSSSMPSEMGKSYIFYGRSGEKGDKDPLTILKALPATDANRRQVADSITSPVDSVLCGSATTPEHAAEKADVILVGEVVKGVQPTLFSIKAFSVDRGLVAHGDLWIHQEVASEKKEVLASEGGSYVFFLGKTDPYNTNDFNVLKVLPATPENVALAEKLARQFPGPKGPEDYNDGKVRIHIAPDVNND